MAIGLPRFLKNWTVEARPLNSVPVIGWESKKCNANRARIHAYKTIPSEGVIGGCEPVDKTKRKVRWFNTASNAGKLLGSFPFVTGQIVGLSRIITTIADDSALYDHQLLNKAKHIVRGLSEIAGVGVVWFALDITTTAGRFFKRVRHDNGYAQYNNL